MRVLDFSVKKVAYVMLSFALLSMPSFASAAIPVTYSNYVEAQTSMQMNDYQKMAKGVNKFYNIRTPVQVDFQPTIRMNRDTIYSGAVVNVSEGAVITLPDAGERYLSLLIYNDKGYANLVFYGEGSYELTPENVGSDYAFVIVRAFVDPDSAEDVKAVNALQDKYRIDAKAGTPFKQPDWDMTSFDTVNSALVGLYPIAPNSFGMFGTKESVDPIRFLVGAAGGFGALPTKGAVYMNVLPKQSQGASTMTFKDVPVKGFFSVTVYDEKGYMFESDGVPSLNNVTASPSEDGSYTFYFGDCDKNKTNCLGIKDGWNFVVRLYQPEEVIQNGTWTLPELVPVK